MNEFPDALSWAVGVFAFRDEFGRCGGSKIEPVVFLVVGGRHVEGSPRVSRREVGWGQAAFNGVYKFRNGALYVSALIGEGGTARGTVTGGTGIYSGMAGSYGSIDRNATPRQSSRSRPSCIT